MTATKKSAKKPTAKKIVEETELKAADVIKKSHLAGFATFIREQGVVGLAVGLAIGAAAGDTVKKLVQAFIDPLVQLIVGSQAGLQAASFTVEFGNRQGVFLYGAFVSSLITLLATALVVYLIVHLLHLDKLDKAKEQ